MSFTMPTVISPEKKTHYVNSEKKHECVEFVRQVSKAPRTTLWKKGIRVLDAVPGSIPYGTAIATFGEDGHYLHGGPGHQHAAIYISHEQGINPSITLYEQYNSLGMVQRKTIRDTSTDRQSRNPNWFYVIEV